MEQIRLQKYAQLVVKTGINVQKGQDVLIVCGLDQPEFIRMVVEECYKAGARYVKVKWSYMPISKLHYLHQSQETLSEMNDMEKAEWQYRVDKKPCLLYIESDDPDGLSGTDNEKISKANMARYPIIKPYRDQLENKYQWCICAVPGKEWAKKIFPNDTVDVAMEKLWEAILTTSRVNNSKSKTNSNNSCTKDNNLNVNDDPIEAWREHNQNLKKRFDFLNSYRFDSLEYKSSNGTNFKVGLIPTAKFEGGAETTLDSGVYFNPNIPSEEVFTTPMRGRAEGKVVATKPLSYQGKLIENFWVRFEKGKVVEVFAEKNQDLLEKMVKMDEGSAYLGEVALIAYDSPVNNTGILFYNTLFDENASCHLALGRGFNETLDGFEHMTKEEIEAAGVNTSMIHVDFMIGSRDMDIVGITKDGKRVPIFKNGNWAF